MFLKKIIVIVLNESCKKEFGKEFYDKEKVLFSPPFLKGYLHYLRSFLLKFELYPMDPVFKVLELTRMYMKACDQ